ncbi:MAG: nitroreductase family protein [Muribaculaceae bacterium]|nr:nitroreductase family protein [Muribaculaceae bacterium]
MEITNSIADEFKGNAAYMSVISRVSVRRYAAKPVTAEQVSAILHAAMSAPSGVNKQPWEFIVVDKPELLVQLADVLPYAKMTADAPVAIVVCGNKERFLDGIDSTLWEQDLSASSENILLAAHAIGLGGVWTCIYPHEERLNPVRSILNLPDTLVPFNLIPIGYPEKEHAPMDKWHPERIHQNRL